jgi:hypothetical protein
MQARLTLHACMHLFTLVSHALQLPDDAAAAATGGSSGSIELSDAEFDRLLSREVTRAATTVCVAYYAQLQHVAISKVSHSSYHYYNAVRMEAVHICSSYIAKV